MKLLFLTFFLLFSSRAIADWPEFRGPNSDGSATGDIPIEWSEEKNITWKKAISGRGWSTPVVKDDKVWVTTATVDGTQMSVLCFDYKTGDVLLDRILITCDNPEPILTREPLNSFATCTPVLDGESIYIHFGSFGTMCLDTETFEKKWDRRDIRCSHWRGPASSPVMWKDKIILTFDGADQQFLMALDKSTGKSIWRTDRSTDFGDESNGIPANSGDMRKGFSTPFIITYGGKTMMISNSAKACWAYDPDTGEELWYVNYKTHSPSSRSVYSPEENMVYINTGLGKAEVWAIRIDPEARGDISETHVAWKALKRTPKRSSPVISNGLMFFANDAVASCVDPKSGEVIWYERLGGDYSASLMAVGDYIYFPDEEGLCSVVKASRMFQKVSENHLDSGFMASPAVYKDSLILRTKTHLYRIDN